MLEVRNQHRDTGTPLQIYWHALLFHIHRAYIIYGVISCLTYDWIVFGDLDFEFDPGHRSPYSKYVCDTPLHLLTILRTLNS